MPIGGKGWSAPFDPVAAKKALAQTSAYKAAINVMWVKTISDTMSSTINWRQVVYLAGFYWNATKALITNEKFKH